MGLWLFLPPLILILILGVRANMAVDVMANDTRYYLVKKLTK